MSEFNRNHPAEVDESDTPLPAPGATGIFGALTSYPAAESGSAAATAIPLPQPAAPSRVLPAQPPARSASAPVVHEVKFQAEDGEGSEAESSLQRLLQSLAPTGELPASEPPASEAPTQAPGLGEFTQLLSTLQIPPTPAAAPTPTAAPPPHEPAASLEAGTGTPAPLSSVAPFDSATPELVPFSQNRVPETDPSSFTRLFEALASPAAVPVVASGTRKVDNADLSEAQAEQGRPFAAVPPPTASPGAGTEPHSPAPSPYPSGPSHASFTQLFNALGAEARPAPSQAADYPPLQGRQPSFPPLPPAPSSGFSGGDWPPPASPPVPSRTEEGSDLQSLTQLLQALEHPPAQTSAAGGASGFPGRDAGRGAATAGATVAFTPPESIQRRASRPPAAVSGPGDFTRVLQASALRESGLGSQAAAAQHPPATAAPSAPPVHGAAVPLPPWAAPPMPYAPHLSSLAHANGSLAGLGSAPGVHAQLPGSHLHMQSAFVTPGPLAQEGQRVPGKASSRGTLLPLILMAIIVILVGVLVAVLLRH